MKRSSTLLLSLTLLASGLSSSASAQEAEPAGGADLQLFQPAMTDLGTPATPSAANRPALAPSFGFWLHYARSPLLRAKRDGTVLQEVVGRQVMGVVTVDVPLLSYLSVHAAMPWAFFQHGSVWGTKAPIAPAGIGDLDLGARMTLFDLAGGALGLSLDATLPSGDERSYLGDQNLTLRSAAHASYAAGPYFIGGYAGLRLRQSTHIGDLVIGNELTYGAGLGYVLPLELGVHDIAIYADVYGRAGVENLLGRTTLQTAPIVHAVRASPLEGDVGVRWRIDEALAFHVGVGTGLIGGYGSPLYRVLAGVRYAMSPPAGDKDGDGIADDEDACIDDPEDQDGYADADGCPDLDNDADGIRDSDDDCPLDAEDRDSFEDGDGCPDLDNDSDGRPDSADACPLEPEDVDGFHDEDGCPERDNDEDGLLDGDDGCPLDAEDRDGFEDEDGCPDLDNDADTVLDAVDACPDAPEDKDAFDDEDGCPELDNDKDGVLDGDDRCPIEPEVINGFEDEDGCPDEGRQVVILRAERIEINETIEFDFRKASLRPAGMKLLDQVAQILRGHDRITKVRIEGHTDSVGNDAFNLKLSKDRAGSVLRYLVDQKGIDEARLEADGFGESRPLESNSKEAGRAKNRRVEFIIVEQGAAPAGAAAPPAEESSAPAP